MKLILPLILFISAFSQAPFYSHAFDYYNENYLDINRLGQGNAAIADAGHFTNLGINPGLFYESNQIEFALSMFNKSNAGYTFSTTLKQPQSAYQLALFYPITNQSQVFFSVSQKQNAKWLQGEQFVLGPDDFPVSVFPFYEFNTTRFLGSFSYQFNEFFSLGFGIDYSMTHVEEKIGLVPNLKYDKNSTSFHIGAMYQYDHDLTFGLSVSTPYSMTFKDSIIQNSNTFYFNSLYDAPFQIAFGVNYDLDQETNINVDLITRSYQSRDHFFEPMVFDYRVGVSVKYSDDIDFQFGSFSKSDIRHTDTGNWLDENGFFTQRFITLGSTYRIDDIELNLAYATSDIISGKQSSFSTYGFSIHYKL